MTRRRRPRILSKEDRTEAAAVFRGLADELVRPKSEQVQAQLDIEMDYGYPTTSSVTPSSRSNRTDEKGRPVRPDTKPEGLTIQPDREAREAESLVRLLRRVTGLADLVLTSLKARRPDRPRRFCSRCQHPLPEDSDRCQQLIDGVQCAAREKAERICRICDETQPPGKPLRAGRCDRCRKFQRYHGREFTTVDDYQLQANVIVEDVDS